MGVIIKSRRAGRALLHKMAADTSEELERFRQQWQQEVSARSKAEISNATRNLGAKILENRSRRAPSPEAQKHRNGVAGTDGEEAIHDYHDIENTDDARTLRVPNGTHPSNRHEPTSALEHYEKAVEREGEGSLGDSVSHYRRAYRLDAGVDRLYKEKHFPPAATTSKPQNLNPTHAPVTVPNTAHHSLDGPHSLSVPEAIASYRSSRLLGASPPTDASPPPPCPIASIPSEILVKVLLQTAKIDPASFVRLARVCKRLAYLVVTEDHIWGRVCDSDGFGFRAMHFAYAIAITGSPLPSSIEDLDARLARMNVISDPRSLTKTARFPTYKSMFHARPRIRFNGCYISTVNYIRPGQASATQYTWNSPVLIVTYYRYLRFFRDGSVVSLLTTTEPVDVVHHLTKANLHANHAGGLPSAVMNNALRGRWRLSGNVYDKDVPDENEGIVHIETEGADAERPEPKYIYKMMLEMKGAAKAPTAAQNTKLAWLGYWNYNKLTDDWAEFTLKNDKPFFWSRVKSYDNGY